MAEIIELGLRLSTKELKEAERQFDQTGRAAKKTQQGLDDISRASDKMNDSVNRTTGRLKAMFESLVAIGTLRQLASMSDTWRLMEGRIAQVTKNTEELKETQNSLFEVAQRTRSSFEATVQLYTRVAQSSKNLGKNQQELILMTETVNKALQIGGASSAEAAAGTIQLSQALAAGVLRGDEFRSVLENMPRVAKALEEALGKSRGELIKMAADGQLSSKTVADALLASANKISEEFKKVPATIGQSFTVLGNSMLKFVGTSRVMQGAADLTISAITKMVENIEMLGDIVGVVLGTYLLSKITAIAGAFRTLYAVISAHPFLLVVGAISAMIAYVGSLEKVLLSMEASFVVVTGAITKFGSSAGGTIQAFYNGVVAVFGKIGDIFNAFVTDLQSFIENPLSGISFTNLDKALTGGLTGAFKKAYDEVKKETEAFNTEIDNAVNDKLVEIANKQAGLDKKAANDNGSLLTSEMEKQYELAVKTGQLSGKKTKDAESYKSIVSKYISSLREEVHLAGLTASERSQLQAVYEIENQLKEKNLSLTRQDREEIQMLVKDRESVQKVSDKINDINTSLTGTVKGSLQEVFKGGEDGFSNMITKWSDMLNEWVADMVTEQFFRPWLDSISGYVGGFMSQSSGSGSSGGGSGFFGSILSGAGNLLGSAFGFADGGVVDSPKTFRYGNDNIGMVGEAGQKEGILPLKRNSRGQLGVIAPNSGEGGGSMNTNITVNVTAGPGQDGDKIGNAIASRIDMLMDKKIADFTRRNSKSGGMLNQGVKVA